MNEDDKMTTEKLRELPYYTATPFACCPALVNENINFVHSINFAQFVKWAHFLMPNSQNRQECCPFYEMGNIGLLAHFVKWAISQIGRNKFSTESTRIGLHQANVTYQRSYNESLCHIHRACDKDFHYNFFGM